MGCLVFCNVDTEGNIVDGLAGERVIPDKQYDYYFFLNKSGEIDLADYTVKDDVLTERGR